MSPSSKLPLHLRLKASPAAQPRATHLPGGGGCRPSSPALVLALLPAPPLPDFPPSPIWISSGSGTEHRGREVPTDGSH